MILNSSYKKGNYERLYSKYIFKDVDKLLILAKVTKNKSLLDLGAGTGAVSKIAWKRGVRNITAIEKHKAMLDNISLKIEKVYSSVEDFVPMKKYDIAICRQAINYMDLEKVDEVVHKALKKRGVFVFNSFVNKPLFNIKSYSFNNVRYFEFSTSFGKTVFHVQASKLGIDLTKFSYYNKEDFSIFNKRFSVRRMVEGNSVYYICRKR